MKLLGQEEEEEEEEGELLQVDYKYRTAATCPFIFGCWDGYSITVSYYRAYWPGTLLITVCSFGYGFV